MSRRLKPVKDLSVLILAPRKHDRQLWAELLKNCGINSPLAMADIKQATTTVGAGQVDVVFVDEAYGPQGIANLLVPARNVEFAGGRGVCLILCSKKATVQDVMNARKLGFASLVILPASIGTVQKHLELAARYIPMSDEELGWSAPKIKAQREAKAMPSPKDDPVESGVAASRKPIAEAPSQSNIAMPIDAQAASDSLPEKPSTAENLMAAQSDMVVESQIQAASSQSEQTPSHVAKADDGEFEKLTAPGRSGKSFEEEVHFL